jgi:DNA polymerase elongation subunit (family B)
MTGMMEADKWGAKGILKRYAVVIRSREEEMGRRKTTSTYAGGKKVRRRKLTIAKQIAEKVVRTFLKDVNDE